MKKIIWLATTILALISPSVARAAGDEAYRFGQGLQSLVRQQQTAAADQRAATERLHFLPTQAKDESQAKDDKTETWTMKKKCP